MTEDGPRTIIRPPRGRVEASADRFAGLARPLADLAAEVARGRTPDPVALTAEARRLTEEMETIGLRQGLDPRDLAAARDGLWALLLTRATGNPALDSRTWRKAARRHLPGIETLAPETLRARLSAAEREGKRDLARLLRHCLQAVETSPHAAPRVRGVIALPLLAALLLVVWAGWAEWSFRGRMIAALPPPAAIPTSASPAEAGRALDVLEATVETTAIRVRASPLGLLRYLGRFSPEAVARVRYRTAAEAALPPRIAAGIAASLAADGGSVALYDTLRALAILEGTASWQPDFLAGWFEDHDGGTGLALLARHVAVLPGPFTGLPPRDTELLTQARAIAAEGNHTDFAALELSRAPAMRAIPAFSLTLAVPELSDVLARRSGAPLDDVMPGRLTAAGWAAALGGEADAAITRMRSECLRLFGTPGPTVTLEAVLRAQQRQTLDAWTALLADLRVRPFIDQPTALVVSGALSRRASPLEALFRLVWREVGGPDRSRDYETIQLPTAATFGPMIQFVEEGGTREIANLFATLNVAVAGLGVDADVGRQRLLDIHAQAASVAALNLAPRLVTQIVEDVLAQTLATQGTDFRPRAARTWTDEGAPACNAALTGRYPFEPGPDADRDAVAGFLGPDGQLARLVAGELAPLLDRDTSPWSWKPEARFSGFQPKSAAFIERALAVGGGLLPRDGTMLSLSALAQRGAATISIDGASAPVTTASESAVLAWPGPSPAAGVTVSFAAAGQPYSRTWPGPWGLLHFLDSFRLRARDGGERFLADVSLASSRAFLELTFGHPANPASVHGLTRGLVCPAEL